MNTCPICKCALLGVPPRSSDYGEKIYVPCPNCGTYGLTRGALKAFEQVEMQWRAARGLVSHALFVATSRPVVEKNPDTPLFDQNWMARILSRRQVPSPSEQGSNFIRWLGEQLSANDPAGRLSLSFDRCGTIMCAASGSGADFVIRSLQQQGLLHARLSDDAEIGLSFAGWAEYEKLRYAHSEGPIAFMAMPFGRPELDTVYLNFFKPAVSECGFELRRIDEKPPAGSIDNRLRVEIRRSRFVLVELSDHNPGAYWEAGFAEGLGKPVIFTCEQSHFRCTHFDTNHHHTIQWTTADIGKTVESLKDTIRATLPGEAKMTTWKSAD